MQRENSALSLTPTGQDREIDGDDDAKVGTLVVQIRVFRTLPGEILDRGTRG
jgi:hypothetical protein